MKLNPNYSAGATKKKDPLEEAINSNFSRSQTSQENTPQSQILNAQETLPLQNEKAEIPASVRTIKKPLSDAREAPVNNAKEEDDNLSRPSRREVKEKFLVSMSKGERSVFKAFCAMQNVSMNHFVMCAMDYFKEDLENGKVSLSSHSYKRKES